jgi:hypothetical protein
LGAGQDDIRVIFLTRGFAKGRNNRSGPSIV